MRIDCHAHTKYSFDAFCRPRELVKAAKRAGLDGIAVTDHNTIRGWKELRKLSRELRFPVIFGEEIKTTQGDIIGLFLDSEIKRGEPLEVIDRIKGQDGIVVIPHPFDSYRGFKSPESIAKKVHALEVFNSRVLNDKENKKALEIAKKYRLGQCAGSDAHISFEVGRAYAISQGDTLEDFRKALKKGKTMVYGKLSSPLVHIVSTIAKTGIRV